MKERLQQLLTKLGYTASRLADEIQVQRSGISHILSGRNQPSFDFINRLLTRLPMIEARWLLLGEGEMFISNNKTKGEKETIISNDAVNPIDVVRSEDPVKYKVTNVTKVSKIILLQSDGTFEVYQPGSTH